MVRSLPKMWSFFGERISSALIDPFTALATASVLIVTATVALQALAPNLVGRIDSDLVQHQEGRAYAVELKPRFWEVAAGDNSGTPSQLVLYEDGQQLWRAHASHDEIRNLGEGRYSHWKRRLIFSSTDGTAPTDGTHVYSF